MGTKSFYTRDELLTIGFKSVGENVYISRKSSIYGAENISIQNNVRVDDFCILSGCIQFANYIHIAAYSAIYGGRAGVEIKDFVNVSSRVSIYAECDDFTGISMTNPMVDAKYKKVQDEKVVIGKHAIIGATAVVLPGTIIAEGSAFGSFSFITHDSEPWSVNVGIPCKKIGDRKSDLLELEQKLKKDKKEINSSN